MEGDRSTGLKREEVGGRRSEVGGRRSEVGGWRLEVGDFAVDRELPLRFDVGRSPKYLQANVAIPATAAWLLGVRDCEGR